MRTEPSKRLALTMRVERAPSYDELRDCLARDWSRFLTMTLPGVAWLALPNDPPRVAELMSAWRVDGLILTGGNDIGQYAYKDDSDIAALEFALRCDIPVLGVCRGLQVMQHYFGGALSRIGDRAHAATDHPIECAPGSVLNPAGEVTRYRVNSYHDVAIAVRALRPELALLAQCGDGTVEAARIRGHRSLGVMWHPERSDPIEALDSALVRVVFGAEAAGNWQ